MSFRVLVLAALSLTLASQAAAQASGTDAEKAAVRKALEHYLQGHATGSGAEFTMAFQDSAR